MRDAIIALVLVGLCGGGIAWWLWRYGWGPPDDSMW